MAPDMNDALTMNPGAHTQAPVTGWQSAPLLQLHGNMHASP